MNRLSNYFKSKELVKLMLESAESCAVKDGNTARAVLHMISAIKELMIAQNNIVSIVFEKKKGGRK